MSIVQYVWFGEVVLEVSPEFIATDTGGTLVAQLISEQLSEAYMGGVVTTTPILWDPSGELALYEEAP